ncbi:MAG: ABC transporter ATP-binding protein [Deltaproteobacteria bacterium]|nr:ABC transporter ATP-binding protein [Deltaproteobacteria bacterium]
MVELRNVTKRYGAHLAVRDVTLSVAEGEVLGLLGPNGSGKTTLLRMLTGAHTPTSGQLTVAGFDSVRQPLEARRRVGYVPESHPLYDHMRVREMLSFMAALRGVERGAIRGAVGEVAESLSVDDVLETPVRHLSRGYRQRVAIAQALVHRPSVLVLDEPTNGLDPRQIIETRNLIRGLAGRCTVIMSSHILSEIARTVDRVAILLRGGLLTVRSMAETPDLEALFLSLA